LLAQSSEESLKAFLKESFELFSLIGGYIFATMAFSMYKKPQVKMQLLTMPVSNLMRTITVIFIAVPLFYILYLLVFMGTTQLLTFFMDKFMLSNYIKPQPLSNFGDEGSLISFNGVAKYVLVQSVFLMFGAIFHKLGFIKTGLVLLVLFLLGWLVDSVTSQSAIDTNFFGCMYNYIQGNYSDAYIVGRVWLFAYILKILYWAILPLSLYVVWLRTKEMEV